MTTSIFSPKAMIALGLMGASLMISGCSNVDKALGKSKSSPDEFEVVIRPPLTLPPSFTLTPENEGETLPQQSTDAVSVTSRVLTKTKSADGSLFDSVFGTDQRLANIREIVDEETYGIQLERRLPIDILFGGQPNVGPNLDAKAEAERIRKAIEKGQGLNTSPTLAIDPVEGEQITVE